MTAVCFLPVRRLTLSFVAWTTLFERLSPVSTDSIKPEELSNAAKTLLMASNDDRSGLSAAGRHSAFHGTVIM
jgi:hypothetical protein